MSTAVALIDGEHYPPVVRSALEALAEEYHVVAAAFVGGTEKVDPASGDAYGVPVVRAATAADALRMAIEQYWPQVIVDLSDEPILSAADRFRLASIALEAGVTYRGADFIFTPPSASLVLQTPTLAIIGTGKRVGKTAFSAYVARHLKASGRNVVVLAMGRGGPAEPELIRGDEVALTTEDLLALAALGKHASSDNYEDAVMSRVTTVGCRRCGGGMAGETFFSNVEEGARLADGLGKDLVMLEGSGAAIPPVAADATILVVGASQGAGYIRDYFGPFRVARADAVIIAGVGDASARAEEVAEIRSAIHELRPDVPVVAITLRPAPIEPVEGRRVFFATTAPAAVLPTLVRYLEDTYSCTVVAASAHLSNRTLLRADLAAAVGTFDVLLTELKAAAIDVVAAAGAEAGVPTVLCDNLPVTVDGDDIGPVIDTTVALAFERCGARSA
ncbi:MAG: 2,3-diphosphoglycerate synthetase [Actinomycetota bacterium]|nr:MAG: cyclic 2 3-diphosphoglycerate [Actinomycetota bacterium]MDP3631282.1 2,3-diphosphoglycerate synthetase [Actinomycetota bacterium]